MQTFFAKPALRWLLLGLILATEIIAVTSRFEVPSPKYLFVAKPDAAWLFEFSKEYWQIMLWIIGACLLMVAPNYKAIFSELDFHLHGYRWQIWLTLQILSFTVFVIITSFLFIQPADPDRLTTTWFSVWLVMAGATFGLWTLALAPSHFWFWLFNHNHTKLLVGIILGISAWILLDMLVRQESPLAQKELWGVLSGLTLEIVYTLLGWFYSDLIYEPESSVVGTISYPVEVTYACSGIEGVSLIAIFLAIYLWLFRENLRFPQVLWVFPVAMLAIWFANALRIALLVAVGSSISPDIASMGFHAQAGWIAFTLISIGAIVLTHRMQFFSASKQPKQQTAMDNSLSTALLTPFLVQMAALMLTSAVSSSFDWLYPARVGIIAAVLYYYRKAYNKLFSNWSWQAPVIGVVVFIVWMLLETNDNESGTALSQNIDKLPNELGILWLIFRVLGSVIVIPMTEELAFRGYLIRKLIAKDFENVAASHFTWLSFIVSSLLFGLLHDRWIAGALAGMGYAIAVYRRGQLSDAVIAHMTTNALIAIFVLAQGKWSLWA